MPSPAVLIHGREAAWAIRRNALALPASTDWSGNVSMSVAIGSAMLLSASGQKRTPVERSGTGLSALTSACYSISGATTQERTSCRRYAPPTGGASLSGATYCSSHADHCVGSYARPLRQSRWIYLGISISAQSSTQGGGRILSARLPLVCLGHAHEQAGGDKWV